MLKELFADIILPLPLNNLFTYSIPKEFEQDCAVGKRVVVQFGRKKLYSGIVRKIHNNKPEAYQTKDILSVIDNNSIIDNTQFDFWEWIASYYLCPLGDVYKAALPSGLKLESETKVIFNTDNESSNDLTPNEALVLEIIENENIITISKLQSIVNSKSLLNTLSSLVDKKAVLFEESLRESYKPLTDDYVKLNENYSSEEAINILFEELKSAPKQTKLVIAYLSIHGFNKKNEVKKSELLKKANASVASLKTLIDKGFFELYKKERSRIDTNNNGESLLQKDLNTFQKEAFDNIKTEHKEKDVVLLHGITSSGKTEIYIHYIEEIIQQGKQVLYLLPEIALTTQIINRLKAVFGDKVGIYHSKFSDAERVEIWKNIQQNNESSYKIILGVRSSVFLPYKNLGLIIIDEEHENTYKQFNPSPRYNARDAAIVLAHFYKAKILLGTATPSMESYYNSKYGKYGYVSLTKRYKEIQLPEILVANTREAYRKKQMQGHFTPQLIDHIQQALDNKEQIILFQNRRGFSPYLECELCSWIPKCQYCDVSLTYHKHNNTMVCHYCGYTERNTGKCFACGNSSLNTKGFGTEKIENEINIFFPDAKVERMDLDTTRSKNAYHKILGSFESKKTDILVGTQMVSKGLDFDNVSIVGILNADNMLNFPDFRAFERSYQLMAQVSGRAGRSGKRGKVIIQTADPKHKIIQYLLRNDYESMYASQIKERHEFKYPPYFRLLELTVKHKNADINEKAAQYLTQQLRSVFGNRILGPHTPLVSRIQSYYLKNIVIKIESDKALKKIKIRILQIIGDVMAKDYYKSVQVSIDVDPQ